LFSQIYTEAKKFAKMFGIAVVCAYGGGSMYEQQKACGECPEIIVCTPGNTPFPDLSSRIFRESNEKVCSYPQLKFPVGH